MRHRVNAARDLLLGVALAATGFVAMAQAKTIKLPDASPEVVFDVPDDWTVTSTPLGVDVSPPDKSALIVSGLVKRDREALSTWQKDATERMMTFGVAFDKKASKATNGSPAPTANLFSGAPSIATPEQGPNATTGFEDKAKAGLSLEDLTGRAPPKSAKIPFNGLVIYGASYLGIPVDAEFLNFALSPTQLFLMQQESGKTDDRIAGIIETVRRP